MKKSLMNFPLKPIDKNEPKRQLAFQVLDIETRNWTKFICAGIYDGVKYTEFRSLKSLIKFIYECPHNLNLFAHYGGGFDMLFVIYACLRYGVEIKNMIPRGSLLLNMTIKGKFKNHTIRDSSALFPFSLKKLTENAGIENKKGDYDHSKNRGYNKELSNYLKDDCLGLYQVLEKYYNSEMVRGAGPATTIASQAQKIFRTYLKKSIKSPDNDQNEFMRRACHGGRTEIFKPIGKKIFEFDVNSLYPYCMKNFAYPSGKCIETNEYKPGKLGIYEVDVKSPDIHIPIIPFKDDKKLLFPKGKFTTVITSAEIEYGRSIGYKFRVKSGFYFRKSEFYFKEIITDLWNDRQKFARNTIDNILTKLIMNSLYGKFILNPDKTNLIIGDDGSGEAEHFRDITINGKLFEIWEKPVKLNSFIHCGIGAFILAHARIHMHRLMYPISDHVYYTDTDSIWTDKILPSSDELGALKLERPKNSKKDFYDKVCFLLPKTYIAESGDYKKIAMKGFDSRKIQHFTYKDFNSALIGELKLSVDHDQSISKLKSALKKNKVVMLKARFNKQIKSKYNKRILNLKQNNSVAITLP